MSDERPSFQNLSREQLIANLRELVDKAERNEIDMLVLVSSELSSNVIFWRRTGILALSHHAFVTVERGLRQAYQFFKVNEEALIEREASTTPESAS